MFSLYDKIRAAHPTAGESDFILRDDADGNGPQIVAWNEARLGPKPDAATLPDPPVFDGTPVFSAEDVDRVTARRIRALLGGAWEGVDAQMVNQAMLRKVEDLLAAVYTATYDAAAAQAEVDAAQAALDAGFALRGQIQALRDEAAAFKAAQGW